MPVIRSWSRTLGFSFAGGVALGAAAQPAHADGDPMVQCIAASDQGLDLRKQEKLIESRQALATCAAPACGVDISGVCQKRLAEVSAALPSIVFSPKDGVGNDVTGVKMYVDGASVGETLDGRPLTLNPGPHTFKFEMAGLPPVQRSFVLTEGAKDRQERIDMAPSVVPPTGLVTVTPLTSSAPPARTSGTQKTVGFVVGGLGLAAIGAGSVFGLFASSKWSASKDDCSSSSPTGCPNHAEAVIEHNAAVTDGTISTVAFAAGGAAVVTALFLVLLAPRESSSQTVTGASVRLFPSIGSGGASLSVVGAF
jgi:hypothetical protein